MPETAEFKTLLKRRAGLKGQVTCLVNIFNIKSIEEASEETLRGIAMEIDAVVNKIEEVNKIYS